MAALAWLLIPLIVTIGAFVVVGARSRPTGPVEPEQGMEGLDRMRAAMERPMPAASETAATPDLPASSIELRPPLGKGTAAA